MQEFKSSKDAHYYILLWEGSKYREENVTYQTLEAAKISAELYRNNEIWDEYDILIREYATTDKPVFAITKGCK
jgi:hypothetical protein